MPFLSLRDLRTGYLSEFDSAEVRVGRDPGLDLTVSGEGSHVVSGSHIRFFYRVGRWWIEDTGSRNGTYIGDRRLVRRESEVIAPGTVIRLGKTGPRLRIEAAASRALDATFVEQTPEAVPAETPSAPGLGPAAPRPPPMSPIVVKVVLEEARSGQRFEAAAARIRIGRGADCEVRPIGMDDQLISRIHSEILLKDDGSVVVRDARSVNGTYLNGEYLESEERLNEGDQIALGEEGPVLVVEKLSVSLAGKAAGGLSTLLVRRVVEEISQGSAARVRQLVWTILAVVVTAVVGLYLLTEKRERDTAAAFEEQRRTLEEHRLALEDYRRALARQRATTDSVLWAAATEYERLRSELEVAREGAAPAVVVDSLRLALMEADRRTQALEASLARSQAALTRQLAAGDSARRRASAEVARLQAELEGARQAQVSPGLLDSLRQAIQEAEEQASSIGAQLRAVSGVNLAAVAQANQAAVGLVTVFMGLRLFDGSGFVITPSGYFVTNRHVAQPDGEQPDSVFVTMADERFRVAAEVVAVAPPGSPDLAVLRILDYRGAQVEKVDWSGTKATQGEPAALIGFPAGLGAALDQTRRVRTSMSAGIFSKVTPELIQFDGFTVEGSSGSPVFNASGEVVAVHRGSLRGATGLAFAVPIKQLVSLLPPEVKAELGIE